MKKSKILLLLCFSFLLVQFASAQEKTLSGVVTAQSDGMPLPGVGVLIQGTLRGVETDFDGKYQIKVSVGDVLVFSYVGMKSQSITISNQEKIDVSLEDANVLNEVVVTALGIKKEAKKLGYSIQTVKAEELTKVKTANVSNAISGRVTGVQINQNGSGLAGSSSINVRGISSLVPGNNQPLIVVDGVILDSGGLGQGTFSGGLDYGTGLSDINPDDIASVNILKGGNATALYGYRGASGVVVITTKRGKAGAVKVELSSSSMFDNVLVSPRLQNSYGQGFYNADTDALEYDITRSGSWGPALDGSLRTRFDGVGTEPYSASEGTFEDFYRTGTTFINSVGVSGGSENANYRLSYTNLLNNPILRGSTFERNSITLNTTGKINDKLRLQAKISYTNNYAENRPDITDGQANTVRGLILKPRNVSNASLEANYLTADGRPNNYGGGAFTMNPYYAINTRINDDVKNRYVGLVSATYDVTSDLSATLRYSQDQSFYNARIYQPIGAFDIAPTGGMVELNQKTILNNLDLLLSYNTVLTDNLTLSSTFGASKVVNKAVSNRIQGNELLDSSLFSINNFANKTASTARLQSESQSVFGSMQFGFNDNIFVELTARNDWSSTLPSENNSFFYPSVGTSFLLHDILDIESETVNSLKLRASWAKTGNATSPYQLASAYNVSSLPYNDLSLFYLGNIGLSPGAAEEGAAPGTVIPNRNLVPELSTEYEFGLDASFFNNRLGIDFTYYNKDTKNQILQLSLPPTSGAEAKVVNAGLVNNSGYEIGLTATPIKNDDFSWNTRFNFTKNTNEIVELAEGLPSTIIARQFSDVVQLVATEGRQYGDLVGTTFSRDANGNKIYDINGLPVVGESDVIGNVTPDFLLGITNTLSYKNFELDFLLDIRSGGDVFSFTDRLAASQGVDEITLQGREFYTGGNGILVPANATIEGGVLDPQVAARGVEPGAYFGRLNGISENWITDGSFVKLRQLSLTYKLPKSFLSKLSISSASISYVGRNLAILHKNTKNFDPEVGFNTAIQGIEFFDMPSTSTHGVKIDVSF